MNWDALGAVGETVGAFAVVITVAYLALQIRSTRRDFQAQGTERSMGFWSVWRTTLLVNSDLSQTVAKANQGEVLTENERIQLEILTDELFYGASIAYSRAIHSGAIHHPEDAPQAQTRRVYCLRTARSQSRSCQRTDEISATDQRNKDWIEKEQLGSRGQHPVHPNSCFALVLSSVSKLTTIHRTSGFGPKGATQGPPRRLGLCPLWRG